MKHLVLLPHAKAFIKCLCALALLFAESLFSDALSVDESVISGTLENGLTYFIRENNYPKEQAQLRLIVKVGSAYENENEQGIAHFVEHLVFRGSAHFQDWEIVDYLESIGAEFGPDTNAYTSFDETLYMLNIPLEQEGALDTALLILSDFAGRAHLDCDMIEAERGVVLDELRVSDSAEMRAVKKEYSWIFEGSSYDNRFPAGLPEIVRNASHELVRNFYKRHYRPDNMALIAVGDFEGRKVEESIHHFFSSLESQCEGTSSLPKRVSLSEETKIFTHVAEGACFTNLSMVHLAKPKIVKSDEDLFETRLSTLIFTLLDQRLAELAHSPESPIIFGNAISGRHSIEGGYEFSRITAVPYEGYEKEALQALLRLYFSLFQHGVSQEELDQVLKSEKEVLFEIERNRDRHEHGQFVSILTNHVLEGRTIFDFNKIIQKEIALLDSFDLSTVNDFLTHYEWETPWHFSLVSPKDIFEGFDLLRSLEEWREGIPAYEGKKRSPLSESVGEAGKIIAHSEEEGIKIYTLSNGMKIYAQKSLIQKEEILIKAMALGGTASFESSKWSEARMLPLFLAKQGFGGLDAREVELLMSEKNIFFSPFVELNMRGIKGSCSQSNFALFCHLFHLYFTDKERSDEGFTWMKRISNEIKKFVERNPEASFEEYVMKMVSGQHPYFQEIQIEELVKESFFQTAEDLFSNPADFTLFIAGDFDEATLERLLERYLASIPEKEKRSPIFNTFEFPKEGCREIFKRGGEEKALTKFLACVDFPEAENQFTQDVLRKTVETRLFNALRRDLGDTYGVSVSFNHFLYPLSNPFLFKIEFTHSPEETDRAISYVEQELDKLKSHPLTASEMKAAREIIRTDLQEARQENSYLLSDLEEYFLYGSLSDPMTDLKDLTSESISSYVQEIFSQTNWKIFTLQAE